MASEKSPEPMAFLNPVDVDFGLDWLDLNLSRTASHFDSSPDPSFVGRSSTKGFSSREITLFLRKCSWLTKIQEDSPCQRCSVTLNFIIPKAQVFHVFSLESPTKSPKLPAKSSHVCHVAFPRHHGAVLEALAHGMLAAFQRQYALLQASRLEKNGEKAMAWDSIGISWAFCMDYIMGW